MTDHPGESQIWADHHTEWSKFPVMLYRSVSEAFAALNRVQFSAPWRQDQRAPACVKKQG
jgi:hypothetical protein